jgi:hypothetical protein
MLITIASYLWSHQLDLWVGYALLFVASILVVVVEEETPQPGRAITIAAFAPVLIPLGVAMRFVSWSRRWS